MFFTLDSQESTVVRQSPASVEKEKCLRRVYILLFRRMKSEPFTDIIMNRFLRSDAIITNLTDQLHG